MPVASGARGPTATVGTGLTQKKKGVLSNSQLVYGPSDSVTSSDDGHGEFQKLTEIWYNNSTNFTNSRVTQ